MAKRHKPKNDNQAIDPVEEIHSREQRLRDELAKEEKELSDDRGRLIFNTGLAAGAFALDWTFCGGFFTVLAAFRAADTLSQQIKTSRLRKEHKTAEEDLTDILKMQAKQQPGTKMKEDLKKEFSEAARLEMEEMQQRIKDLEAQVADKKKDPPQAPRVRIV
jgi:gas vesicle protein